MNYQDKIFLSITTHPKFSWRYKINEADRLGIDRLSIFLTFLKINQRQEFYNFLEKSSIQYIPHVHIRDDFKKWELELFFNQYGTRYFNFHEHSFDDLYKWPGFEKNIYLEYNYNNRIPKLVDLKKIGGLCVDLSHFWAAKNRGAREYDRIVRQAQEFKIGCNHLNGYSKRFKCDLHYIRSLSNFDYLKKMPKKYFGQVISLETNNSLRQQLIFKKYIVKLLNSK
ncbi:hypothetical protein IID20_02760 [Patescibacteria group bacterium]|nr:hypothetical protein [Patescibacteria group bacterium]